MPLNEAISFHLLLNDVNLAEPPLSPAGQEIASSKSFLCQITFQLHHTWSHTFHQITRRHFLDNNYIIST